MEEYTASGGVRPMGISLLLAGVDEKGPKLYQVDASGTFYAWKATAIGKNAKSAKGFLEKRFEEDMELEDAIQTALLTLKDGFEGQLTEKNIEIGVISTSDNTFRVLSTAEVRDYIKEAE